MVAPSGSETVAPATLAEYVGDLTSKSRATAGAAGVALVAATLVHFGIGARGVIEAFLVAALPLLAVIDLERRVLPNRIVLPALGLVLLAQVAFFPGRAFEWVGAAVGAGVFFLIPLLVSRRGVGMGDVKLAALIGAALGRDVVLALAVASLAVLPVALWLLIRHGRAARTTAIPFGPFLALGGVIALFFGGSL